MSMKDKINVTKEMFQHFIEANKTNNGKILDIETYKKSKLDAETYIYIADHIDDFRKKYQKGI